jgi:hypothetical protein
MIKNIKCTICGNIFSYEHKTNKRWVCSSCKRANEVKASAKYNALPQRRIIAAQNAAKFRSSPKGKATIAVYKTTTHGKAVKARIAARYNASPKGKASKSRIAIKYRSSLKGQITESKYMVKYYNTLNGKASRKRFIASPKGFACEARHYALRRKRSTNPPLFALRVLQLHMLKESCAICGKPYQKWHAIDHIVALCNGGKDEWDNYQPICGGRKTSCHVKKTTEDIKIYNLSRHG